MWGSSELGVNGYVEAGLPNIIGQLPLSNSTMYDVAAGAFTVAGLGRYAGAVRSGKPGYAQLDFSASRSNPIYSRSNTVQPPSVRVRVYTYYQ